MRIAIILTVLLCCRVALAPPPSTSSQTGMKTNQFTTAVVGAALPRNVVFDGPSNHVSGDLNVAGKLGINNATAKVLSVTSIVIEDGYNPTNFIPIPGKIRLSPSNGVLYYVSKSGGTNAIK